MSDFAFDLPVHIMCIYWACLKFYPMFTELMAYVMKCKGHGCTGSNLLGYPKVQANLINARTKELVE